MQVSDVRMPSAFCYVTTWLIMCQRLSLCRRRLFLARLLTLAFFITKRKACSPKDWLASQLQPAFLAQIRTIVQVLSRCGEEELNKISESIAIFLRTKLGESPLLAVDEAHVLYRHFRGCILPRRNPQELLRKEFKKLTLCKVEEQKEQKEQERPQVEEEQEEENQQREEKGGSEEEEITEEREEREEREALAAEDNQKIEEVADEGAESEEDEDMGENVRSLFSLFMEEIAEFSLSLLTPLIVAGTALSLNNLSDIDSSVAKLDLTIHTVSDFPYLDEESIMEILHVYLSELPPKLCAKLASEMKGKGSTNLHYSLLARCAH